MLWFVHADADLPPDGVSVLRRALADGAESGCFGFAFQGPRTATKQLLESLIDPSARIAPGFGAVAVTLVLDERGALDGEPEISTVGLYEPDEENEAIPELEIAIEDAVHRLGKRERKDDTAVEEAAGQAVRRTVNRLLGKKPMTMVHVIRLE